MAHMSMTLCAVNHRLTNLPVQKLPAIAASLAASIAECGELLSVPQSHKANKADSDQAVQVHKLVTRLSSLLQDRSFEGRWAAVVLVKALVEAGQWEILRGSETFVRGLMNILSKSDPTSTKAMAIITLTRIFHLTYQYPTLVREITTPSLPGFVTTTLNLISVKPSSEPTRKLKPQTPLLEVILRAYAELIARHPTIFRPFSAQIHSILQAIVGSTSASYSQPVLEITGQLFIALHHCAPKNTGGEEWKSACRMTINSIHATANHVLRAIVEQWESVDPSLQQQLNQPINYALEPGSQGSDALGLADWQGLDSGVKRLQELLLLLSTFLTSATASTVSIPIGSLLDLTARLMSVVVPSDSSEVQANPQVSRTERENLFAELPQIHVACIKVFRSLIKTLETATIPVAQTILEQTLWVFRAEMFNKKIRTSVYGLVYALLQHMGASMNKKNVSSLTDIIRNCCSDLLPQDVTNGAKDPSDSKGKSKTNAGAVNADSFLNPNLKQSRQTNTTARFPRLPRAASNLLQTILTHVPMEHLAAPIRTEIDRTIIMTSDKNAMYASVLNPLPAVKGRGATVSIMPFLARSYTSDMDVEALIRPRMPVLTNSNSIGHYGTINMDEDEDEEMETTSVPRTTQADNTDFLKPASTPNLQDLVDSSAPQSNKRTLTEETILSNSTKTPAQPDVVQPKKARFYSVSNTSTSTTTAPDQPASVPASTSPPFSSTRPVSIQSNSVSEETTLGTGVSKSTSVVVEQSSSIPPAGQAATVAEDDDSDEEMPTLNIEPDTDEDEDEE
ncbi:RIX1/PELP1 family protein [Aspergillus undulatus]|uniref:RIX1/PELP1 family protein n=1 Tax=Aspergillus undulatus TaxID=1810928 RepID=UPI003CCE4F71